MSPGPGVRMAVSRCRTSLGLGSVPFQNMTSIENYSCFLVLGCLITGSSPDRMFNFVEAVMYPRGPLHPTHAVVLRAHQMIRVDIYNRRADEHASPCKLNMFESTNLLHTQK